MIQSNPLLMQLIWRRCFQTSILIICEFACREQFFELTFLIPSRATPFFRGLFFSFSMKCHSLIGWLNFTRHWRHHPKWQSVCFWLQEFIFGLGKTIWFQHLGVYQLVCSRQIKLQVSRFSSPTIDRNLFLFLFFSTDVLTKIYLACSFPVWYLI